MAGDAAETQLPLPPRRRRGGRAQARGRWDRARSALPSTRPRTPPVAVRQTGPARQVDTATRGWRRAIEPRTRVRTTSCVPGTPERLRPPHLVDQPGHAICFSEKRRSPSLREGVRSTTWILIVGVRLLSDQFLIQQAGDDAIQRTGVQADAAAFNGLFDVVPMARPIGQRQEDKEELRLERSVGDGLSGGHMGYLHIGIMHLGHVVKLPLNSEPEISAGGTGGTDRPRPSSRDDPRGGRCGRHPRGRRRPSARWRPARRPCDPP